MKSRLAVLVVVVLVSVIVSASLVHADVFLKQKHHTDAMQIMGQTQPAQDLIQSIWMTQDKMRSDNEKQSMIIRLDKGVIYMIDHAQKTYVEMPLNLGKSLVEAAGGEEMTDEERAQFEVFAQGMMKLEIKVTETKEEKEIGKWNCRKYLQQTQAAMVSGTSEVWATEDLKMDYDLFAKLSAALLATQPGFGGSLEEAAKEMRKIKGIPVLSTSTMQVMNHTVKSSQELLEFKQGKAPDGIFDLPKGYRKQERSSPPPAQLPQPGPGERH